MVTLTRARWKKFAPGCPANYTEALFNNLNLLEEAGILNNELRWCHFAATVYAETGNFREIREDLKYRTCKALRKSWPSRFGHLSDEELKPLLNNPVVLGERVYGLESRRKPGDLGNTLPGDGYAFRGGGWFNTTGRGCVEAYLRKLGLPTPADPGVLDDPVLTLRFAVFEWVETNCNRWADENEIIKVAKAVNTGSATSGVKPNGMDNRREAFARAWAIWGDSGEADKPVTAGRMTPQAVIGKYVAPTVGAAEVARQVAPSVIETAKSVPLPEPETLQGYVSVFEQVKGLVGSVGPTVLTWLVIAAVVYGGVTLYNRWHDAKAASRKAKYELPEPTEDGSNEQDKVKE